VNDEVKQFYNEASYTQEKLNLDEVSGIKSIKTDHQMIIELAEDISKKSFKILLNFFYTGIPLFPDSVTDREIIAIMLIMNQCTGQGMRTLCNIL
jgi:deoxyhypusine synthase